MYVASKGIHMIHTHHSISNLRFQLMLITCQNSASGCANCTPNSTISFLSLHAGINCMLFIRLHNHIHPHTNTNFDFEQHVNLEICFGQL